MLASLYTDVLHMSLTQGHTITSSAALMPWSSESLLSEIQTQTIHVLTLMYNWRDICKLVKRRRWRLLTRSPQPLFFNFGLDFLDARSYRLTLSILMFQLVVKDVFLASRIVPSRIHALYSPLGNQAIPYRLIISTSTTSFS
jgi:hypothetical protein